MNRELRVRGATGRDIRAIDALVTEYNFPNFDVKHIEMAVVVEDTETSEIIAVGTLTTTLEATFMTDKSKDKRSRVEALKMCLDTANREVKILGFDNYTVSVKDAMVAKTLTKKFGFTDAIRTLIHFVR